MLDFFPLSSTSSSMLDYGQKGSKKYGDENTSIYSEYFSPEYAFILENAETLEAQFKKQPAHLERLYGNFFYTFIMTFILRSIILI